MHRTYRKTMPVPEERVYTAIAQLADSLAALQKLHADPQRTGVRLVMVPEPVILCGDGRALTCLSLFGLNGDSHRCRGWQG
ncbi:MAG: hypothetical protein KGJ86_02845 [Chloroflexota bacterium]|nr:hypothetical protein [Chloroflexota bacterium]